MPIHLRAEQAMEAAHMYRDVDLGHPDLTSYREGAFEEACALIAKRAYSGCFNVSIQVLHAHADFVMSELRGLGYHLEPGFDALEYHCFQVTWDVVLETPQRVSLWEHLDSV